MTFFEAREEVRKRANGRAFKLSYDLMEYSSGKAEAGCYIWIEGALSVRQDTWAKAIHEIDKQLNPTPPDPEEAPGEEQCSE